MKANTTGTSNTATGVDAMLLNTTGGNCTASGVNALYANTTGNNHTAIGVYAMYNNTTGAESTALGYSALSANTTGNSNTAVGNNSLSANTTGTYNTAIGYNANTTSTTFDNTVALGQYAVVTASNQARIGNYTTSSIGGQVGWTTVSDKRFKKDIKEMVPGLSFIMKLRPVTYHIDKAAMKSYLKSKMPDFESNSNSILQTGFIAQEVEQAAKESNYDFSGVDKPKNDNDFYGLRYAEFVVPMVKAMQEQQKTIEEQKAKIESLENRLKAIEEKLNK